MPFDSLSFHVVVSRAVTDDLRLTPTPTRWKLCAFVRSRTTIEYVPALTLFSAAPAALRSEIVDFGPTVASSLGTGVGAGFGGCAAGGLPTVITRTIWLACGSQTTV